MGKLNLKKMNINKIAYDYNICNNTDGRGMYAYDSDMEQLFKVSGIDHVESINVEKVFDFDRESYEPVGCEYGDYLETIVLEQNGERFLCKTFVIYNGCSCDVGLDLQHVYQEGECLQRLD